MIDLALGDIGNRREFGVVIGVQRLRCCSGAASAAADQAHFDGVRDRLARDDGGESSYQPAADRLSGVLNERATMRAQRISSHDRPPVVTWLNKDPEPNAQCALLSSIPEAVSGSGG
jgi:hypothetical protein